MTDPLTRVRRGAFVLWGFTTFAIVVHHGLTRRSWLESAHWLVVTISSVGYGEKSLEGPAVQAFTIFVILVGISLAAYTLGGFLQLLTQGEIDRALGVRRMSRGIDQLTGHTIICGYGRLGQTLAEELAAHRDPFVVVERDAQLVAEAAETGCLFVVGDATQEESLEKAGVQRAKALIVALDSDADNVFLTLTARNLNPTLTIIARGDLPTTEKKLLQAGANRVVMPALLGARRIAHMINRPHAAELIDLVTDRRVLNVQMEELPVGEESPWAGTSIRDAGTRAVHRLLIVALRRADGTMVFNPDADLVVRPGDTAIVMGKREDIEKFRQEQRL